eukprot:TRINITY_DN11526_c0_g1_i1.p1 TRINITY_DN11526_c0_g1~~TRINITY_DN11526_c0_g1_i1.p1  ORF type:complete len:689 (-),score=170.12 TRINITY_DN11526_c0_g1_i1:77-1960(-)
MEIYIFCVAHPDKIAEHIQSSKWLKVPGLNIKTFSYSKAQSEGDALREMCKKMILREDFILISGDVIANLDLQPAIDAHQQRRKKNKECMMTAVLREAPPGHRSRAFRDDIMAAIDETTQQIVGYETKCNASFLQVNKKLGTHAVVFRNDLLDCRIAVCSLPVLQSFEDNFDYTLISQFICGVVNEEILGAQVHAYVASDKYAARVNCLRSYKAITQDVINRWSFPLVPDNNITGTTNFTVGKFRTYKDRNVNLSRSAIMGQHTLLGHGTSVNNNSRIEKSTIGNNCKIGKNVNIRGCIIWDNVVIEDDVTIIDSIVATGAIIKSNVSIQKGSIISFGVVVGSGITLSPFTKLTTSESKHVVLKDLGEGGVGEEYAPKKRSEFGTEFVPQDWELEVQEEDEDSDDSDVEVLENARSKFLKAINLTVRNCCVDGFAGEGSVENSKTELMATKLAFDVDFLELAEGVVISLLNFTPFDDYQFKQNCRVWSRLLKKFLKDSDNSQPEKELIFKIQEYSEDHPSALKIFPDVLKGVMETIIDKSAVLEWAEELKEEDDEACAKLLEQCSELLSAIQCSSGSVTESDDEWWGANDKKEGSEDEWAAGKDSGNTGDSGEEDEDDDFSFDSDSF